MFRVIYQKIKNKKKSEGWDIFYSYVDDECLERLGLKKGTRKVVNDEGLFGSCF